MADNNEYLIQPGKLNINELKNVYHNKYSIYREDK